MEKKEKKNELDKHKNPRIFFKLACKTTLSRDFFPTETRRWLETRSEHLSSQCCPLYASELSSCVINISAYVNTRQDKFEIGKLVLRPHYRFRIVPPWH